MDVVWRDTRFSERRAGVDSASNRSYLEWIFKAPIVDRVQVVILSGLQDEVFTEAREFISENSRRQHIHVAHISYLGSRILDKNIDSQKSTS